MPATKPDRMFSDGPPSRDDADDLPHVRRLGRGKHLHELGNDRAGERAAGDHGRQLPPQRAVAERRNEQVGHDVGDGDRHDRRQPHQRGQRRLEVHLVGGGVARLRHRLVDEVRQAAGDDHHDAHHEDPDEQLHLHRLAVDREQDERDERDAGHAVGLEAVGAGADRVAGVVADAVRDHARVAGIVFLDVEDDLHQVRADVGDLREDAAGDPQRRGAERLADREADEAGARVVARDEQQDAEHQEAARR